jgi:hypothetical protein
MRRILVFVVCLSLLVFALAGTSYAWQGRMAGTGDPYGLLSDESDFLIHPAKLAKGEGIRFYGDYRFTYTDVMDWDYNLDWLNPAGVLQRYYQFNTSGQEYSHNVLVGAGFPLGSGRMGIFFTYDGMRGDYDGDEENWTGARFDYYAYELRSDLDNFALRLLYGLPLNGFNLGGEVQFAYQQDENETWIYETDMSRGWLNYPWGQNFASQLNLLPFMLPYDSAYWEALLKGSLEGNIGPLDVEFTLRGGFIFCGDNAYEYKQHAPVGNLVGGFDLDGGVDGWQIGGDLWMRYSLADGLALPFLVRVDYQTKTRDGAGLWIFAPPASFEYDTQERNVEIEAGGGVDKEFGKGARIAAGIYYNYLQRQSSFWLWLYDSGPGWWEDNDYSDYPAHTEHQIVVRLAGELEISPVATLRMGLVPFYGWVREDFEWTISGTTPGGNKTDALSLNGYHWGIGGSFGASIKLQHFTLEPSFNVGWQQYDLDGDGERTQITGVVSDLFEIDKMRSEWYIGGGFSILFDVP